MTTLTVNRACLAFVVALVTTGVVGPSVAQDTQPALDSELPRRLEWARVVITDTGASPEARRVAAEALLEIDQQVATDLAIELLQTNGDPRPRIAVCEAVSAVAGRNPDLLDERLVAPLLELLGEANDSLRSGAATALAGFPNGQVATELGELAATPDAPLPQRLTAVDALGQIVDRRQVVQQLISLLDSESDDVRERVFAALKPAAGRDCGTDVDCWERWWQEKSALGPADWWRDRAELFKQRNRELQDSAARQRESSEQRLDALSRRLHTELEAIYRLTPLPQREGLLVAWLNDPLEIYRAAALARVAADLSDGNKPPDGVRTTLAARLADESPVVRRRVLEVVAVLGDRSFSEHVRARLNHENAPEVREALLYTLGRLQDPAAFAPLIAELGAPTATPGCVVETASSLSLLAAQGNVADDDLLAAVGPLKERLAATPADAVRVRAALLGAMASIGAPDFTDEFLANLDGDNPDLLLAALDGVKRVGDSTRIDRIAALAAHGDARVRRRVFDALAALGGPEHLEALVQRLGPSAEPNEAVRQAAWVAFCAILADQAPDVRLQWAGRLAEVPERETEYLETLTKDLSSRQTPVEELNFARRRLATLYDGQRRQAESLPLWRELWVGRGTSNSDEAGAIGLGYVQAMLAAGRYENLAEVVPELRKDTGRAQQVEDFLLAHLEHLRATGTEALCQAYLEALSRLPADSLSAGFREALSVAQSAPTPE